MMKTPSELEELGRDAGGQYSATDLRLAALFLSAKTMLDGADQTLLRACIDAYIAANGIDPKGVENATLKMLRRMQPAEFVQGLPRSL